MTTDFIATLKSIVGAHRVLTDSKATRPYRTGFRCGEGRALAVVRPRTLVEQWRVLQACIAANKAIIMQAANTGLTGGSTPNGDGYDRDVVIVNTLALDKIHIIDAVTPNTARYAPVPSFARISLTAAPPSSSASNRAALAHAEKHQD